MKKFLLVSLICLCLSVFVQGQTDKFVTYSILDWVPSLTTTPAVGYTLGQVGYNWPIRFPVNTGTVKNIKAWLWDGSNDFKIQVFLKRFDIITETEEDVFMVKTTKLEEAGNYERVSSTLIVPGANVINNKRYIWYVQTWGNDTVSQNELKFFYIRVKYQ